MTGLARWSAILREQILRGLFSAALAWACFAPLISVNADLLSLNPYLEGTTLHHLFEQAAFWLSLLLPLAVAVWMLRRWPGLLRLSPSAQVVTAVLRLVVHGVAWLVILLVVLLAIMYLDYDPAQDHQGQYWPWAVAAALLYASVAAPLGAVFTAWWSLRRKGGDQA
jgi:hypothetical protein